MFRRAVAGSSLRLGIMDLEDIIELLTQLCVIRGLEVAFTENLGNPLEALAGGRIELGLADPTLVPPEQPAEEAPGLGLLEEGRIAGKGRQPAGLDPLAEVEDHGVERLARLLRQPGGFG